MSFSGHRLDSSGGSAFSYASYHETGRVRTAAPDDDGWSSWVSVESYSSHRRQDGSIPNVGQYLTSEMEMEMEMGNAAHIRHSSLSASSNNAVHTPMDDMLMEPMDITPVAHTLQAGPITSQFHQLPNEQFGHPDTSEHDIFGYEQDAPHRHAGSLPHSHGRIPQWEHVPSSANLGPLDIPFSTFLSQDASQDPWTLVQPRGDIPSTTEGVMWDIGEASSPNSSRNYSQSGHFEQHRGSSSPLSTEVRLSISPADPPVFAHHGALFPAHSQAAQSYQMFRHNSAFSTEPDVSTTSTPPYMSFQANQPEVAQQNPHFSTKLEYQSSAASSPSGASPVIQNASPVGCNEAVNSSPRTVNVHHPGLHSGRQINNKIGGRQLGSHLQPAVAAEANRMRKEVACWHCVLQRDKCGPGLICDRCRKRAQRPNTEHGLGCSRVSVRELQPRFLPVLVTSTHAQDTLKAFCARHVGKWEGTEIVIHVTCGWNLPTLPCRVYEFSPLDLELLRYIQYLRDPQTGQRVGHEKWSPPLGIQQQSSKEEQVYEKFVNDIVNGHLHPFSRMLYRRSEDDNFALTLFSLMMRLKLKDKKEDKLLKEIFRLLVVTYVMGNAFVITDKDKEVIFSRLNTYQPDMYPKFCTPRMADRQMKVLFCHLHQRMLSELLNRLQQIFHSSGKGSPRWGEAFLAMLGLAMANEQVQKNIHMITDVKAKLGEVTPDRASAIAVEACREVDGTFQFVMNIFRWKYSRGENPLRDYEQDWSVRLKDPAMVDFTRDIVSLVREKHEYLHERQYVDISPKNQLKYTSRLVARFLLAFWNPT